LTSLEASGAPIAQFPTAKAFRIVPAVPAITSACYTRTNTEEGILLDFRVSGITNTRALTRAQVTIPGLSSAKPNLPVPEEFVFDPNDTLTVEISDLAAGFFSAPLNIRTGGAFTLTIPVTLTSFAPTAALDTIQFNLFNGVGGAGQIGVPVCQ
jgi:hypothetical protein